MKIVTWRIYDEGRPGGYGVLADRLWPRGISKDKAALDEWWKELTPSPALRTWFGHDPQKWDEFREHYLRELSENEAQAKTYLKSVPPGKTLVLLYAAKDTAHSHALILKDYLEEQL
ncbi:MAG: DUF488 family protein [Alphaproteobacteria bacterium]